MWWLQGTGLIQHFLGKKFVAITSRTRASDSAIGTITEFQFETFKSSNLDRFVSSFASMLKVRGDLSFFSRTPSSASKFNRRLIWTQGYYTLYTMCYKDAVWFTMNQTAIWTTLSHRSPFKELMNQPMERLMNRTDRTKAEKALKHRRSLIWTFSAESGVELRHALRTFREDRLESTRKKMKLLSEALSIRKSPASHRRFELNKRMNKLKCSSESDANPMRDPPVDAAIAFRLSGSDKWLAIASIWRHPLKTRTALFCSDYELQKLLQLKIFSMKCTSSGRIQLYFWEKLLRLNCKMPHMAN